MAPPQSSSPGNGPGGPDGPKTYAALLAEYTAPGGLYEKLDGGRVRCTACGHLCLIPDGREGVCRVRFNRGGTLYVPRGYAAALQCDPVEKKPFFHAYPGSLAMSFGMLGCDYHCAYCQNWLTSQALRDPDVFAMPEAVAAEDIIAFAKNRGARILTSTYNEPLITSEWAVEVFRLGKAEGFVTSYVSNGNATPQVLEYIRPWVDLYKIDLKGFDDRHYRREMGGKLETVIEGIRMVHGMGFWLEVVSLLVPGLNDSDEEIRKMAEFLASVSPNIPWHVTAFHPDYKMNGNGATPAGTLLRAAEFGREAGLHYVYAGNIPGKAGEWENTRCPSCGETLIERMGFRVLRNRLKGGACFSCGTKIPGRWETA
jgi:pyruvate formate lyase activating enzyme